jgi:hypothetical protein
LETDQTIFKNANIETFLEETNIYNKSREIIYGYLLEGRNQLELLIKLYQNYYDDFKTVYDNTNFLALDNILLNASEGEIEYFSNLIIEFTQDQNWINSYRIGGRTAQKYLSKTYRSRGTHRICDLVDIQKVVIKKKKKICYKPKEKTFFYSLSFLQSVINLLYQQFEKTMKTAIDYLELEQDFTLKEIKIGNNQIKFFSHSYNDYEKHKKVLWEQPDFISFCKSQGLTEEQISQGKVELFLLAKMLDDYYNELKQVVEPAFNDFNDLCKNNKEFLEQYLEICNNRVKINENLISQTKNILADTQIRAKGNIDISINLFKSYVEIVKNKDEKNVRKFRNAIGLYKNNSYFNRTVDFIRNLLGSMILNYGIEAIKDDSGLLMNRIYPNTDYFTKDIISKVKTLKDDLDLDFKKGYISEHYYHESLEKIDSILKRDVKMRTKYYENLIYNLNKKSTSINNK